MSIKTVTDIDTDRICLLVCELIGFGVPPQDIAVLSRIHGLLEKLARVMTDKDIPHTYVGRTMALTNSEEFRRFHAFLKLLVNPYDNFSFLLIRDLIGLSREEYGEIRLRAAQEGKSHFQVWEKKEIDFFDQCTCEDVTFNDIIGRMAECLTWPFDIQQIIDFINNSQGDTISAYLDWLATYDLQDEIKDTEGVTLSTVHAAKGLEWPVVIVAGCNEGILPSKQSNRSGEIEAERRLMYVAMTRAQDQLILTVRPGKEDQAAEPSRFIAESF
jgi:DNA helicase-2/ATP-dependent DNA helicase PcrA